MRIYRTENNNVTNYNATGQAYSTNNFAKNTVNTKQPNVAFTGILADWFPSIFGSAEVKAAIKEAINDAEKSVTYNKAVDSNPEIQKIQLGHSVAQLVYDSELNPKNSAANKAAIKIFNAAIKEL